MSDCFCPELPEYEVITCPLGTKGCIMGHEGIKKRDQRIAKLEAALEDAADYVEGIDYGDMNPYEARVIKAAELRRIANEKTQD